ncbi:Glyoxalase/Bleomycin resistance protein/Dihydroxybiphenyl dioxygenase [Wilcoxina mikolae CBS 423.85]|nr:Glyoxalase/Bleomycin resistance protein/Dihydroxybiphenyl dioxygenase [Wilcoxina mikolae CBS 423.85]
MPIHHISLNVRDIEEATAFYTAALKPLGYKMRMEFLDGEVRGFGPSAKLTGSCHVAFSAKDRGKVREFYDEALKAGGTCNGPPGVREEYYSMYYAAFVKDPEGRNIEAVCMMPAFWAEKWGCVGWSGVAVVVAVVGAGVGRWWGVC